MKRVLELAAMSFGIGQRRDHAPEFEYRPRPAVRQHQRRGIRVLRADMEEVDIHTVDLGDELAGGVQPRLTRPPIVVVPPVIDEIAQGSKRHALRPIVHRLAFGPAGRVDPTVQVIEVGLGDRQREGANFGHAAGIDLWSSAMISAAFSPIMMTTALMLPLVISGITLASATRRFRTP